MAWIKPRKRKDGTIYFAVLFREHGRQTSLSWDDYTDAQHCAQLIGSVGPEKAREIMRIVASPRHSLTVAGWLTQHIDNLTGVEQGTLTRYRAYVRNDLGTLADIPLSALTRSDVAKWLNNMPGSGKTIANKHGFVAGALNAAVHAGHLKANPCDGNRLPRWDRAEKIFLEHDEFQILLAAVPQYWRPLVQFLVASGCRWSEATALKPADIDLAAGTVRINKAWKVGTGCHVLGVPKTKKSVRTINVPQSVLDDLDLTGEWVFTNSGRGNKSPRGPVRGPSFAANVWAPALKRAQANGLTKPRVRPHDLRHTCASWLIQAGRPLPAVQAHLGHESIQTTVDVYGALDRSSGRDNADAIEQMLGYR